jgi:antitoxin component of MazEF toxin-antitoxin module
MSGRSADTNLTFETRLRKTGSAVGVTLPAAILRHVGLQTGDKVTVGADGDMITILRTDPNHEADLALYQAIEDRFSPAFSQIDDQ